MDQRWNWTKRSIESDIWFSWPLFHIVINVIPCSDLKLSSNSFTRDNKSNMNPCISTVPIISYNIHTRYNIDILISKYYGAFLCQFKNYETNKSNYVFELSLHPFTISSFVEWMVVTILIIWILIWDQSVIPMPYQHRIKLLI